MPESDLTRETVAKVAWLSRLRIADDELDAYTEQLKKIVEYVQQLETVDTAETVPMAHPLDDVNVFRADEPHESLPRDAALANAPKRDDECYRVPAVLGD